MVERTAESLAQTVQQYWLLIKARHNEFFEKCETQPPNLLEDPIRDLRQYMKALHALCESFPSDYPAMIESVQLAIGLAGCLEWEIQALESIWGRLPKVSPNPADARAFHVDGSEFRAWRGYWRSGTEKLIEGMVHGFVRNLVTDRFEITEGVKSDKKISQAPSRKRNTRARKSRQEKPPLTENHHVILEALINHGIEVTSPRTMPEICRLGLGCESDFSRMLRPLKIHGYVRSKPNVGTWITDEGKAFFRELEKRQNSTMNSTIK